MARFKKTKVDSVVSIEEGHIEDKWVGPEEQSVSTSKRENIEGLQMEEAKRALIKDRVILAEQGETGMDSSESKDKDASINVGDEGNTSCCGPCPSPTTPAWLERMWVGIKAIAVGAMIKTLIGLGLYVYDIISKSYV